MTKSKFFLVMAYDNGALEIADVTKEQENQPRRSFETIVYAGTDESAGIDALKQAIAEVKK